MSKKDSREAVLACGLEMILERGYNDTGLTELLARAGIPKGSFYHYFDSKKAFGLAVIEIFVGKVNAVLDDALADTSKPPLARLRAAFETFAGWGAGRGFESGCIVGTFCQEVAVHDADFRRAAADGLAAWKGRIARCLVDARRRDELPVDADPEELAGFIIDAWEGALLRTRAVQTSEPVQTFLRTVFDVLLRCR